MELDLSTTQSKKRSLDVDSSDDVANKEIKIEVPPLNPMVFYPAFPHIVEKIFDKFDKETLSPFFDSIHDPNFLWNRFLKDEVVMILFNLPARMVT